MSSNDPPKVAVSIPARARRAILPGVIVVSLSVLIWSPLSLDTMLEWGHWIVSQPALIVVVVLVQALLFTFALPGSSAFWFIAPFLHPVLSVPILLTGTVLGALGAYVFARRLGGDWRPQHGAWAIDLAIRKSDFFTQCALRTLPGCPHWVVSYAGGILRLPLFPFVVAVLIGIGIKTAIYASVVYGITSAAEAEQAFDVWTFIPLLLMVTFLLIGSFFWQKLTNRAAHKNP